MDKIAIERQYKLICKYHNDFLKKHGVKLPKLFNNGKYTKDALILIKLSENYPDTQVYTKEELTKFIQKFYPDVIDMQQARHLSMQKGWHITSGTRNDSDIPKGSYKLETLKEPYPDFCIARRKGFEGDFETIKESYNYRCATCGSKENEGHFFHRNVVVQLQKGHMNPNLPLEEGNIIPQCQICNRGDRNRWIYDKTGRVIGVAVSQDGVRIVKKFLENATTEIKTEILKFLEKSV